MIWTTRHNARNFVEEVDFDTVQGYNHGTEEQIKNEMVIAYDLGVMNFRSAEPLIQVQSYYPGHSENEIKEKPGFNVGATDDASETPTPSDEIVDLIAGMDLVGIRNSEFG